MQNYNLMVPIAGKGQRMLDGGFEIPKPMLICGDKSILEWSMDSIDYSDCNITFVVNKDHIKNFGIDSWLKQKWPKAQTVAIDWSKGAADSAYQGVCASSHFKGDKPLIVYCPDVHFQPGYQPKPEDFQNEGLILTFKANSANYSYVCLSVSDQEKVVATVEKVVPENSNLASVGVYCFKDTNFFIKTTQSYLLENHKEYHVAPMYNTVLKYAGQVRQRTIEKVHIMGTPSEFKFFEEVSYKYFTQRKFALCADHSGFETKEKVIRVLESLNVEYLDFGCFNNKDCDYNVYVKQAANHVLKNKDFFGIGCCRSGQGVNICANKISGIRSGLISDVYHAKHAIKHNAANFFSLSAIDFEENKDKLVSVLISLSNETFDGGRHQNRMMKNGD
jgi:ribose 5-phosphate isomerase B